MVDTPEWTALWRRICQIATDQPDVQPDMEPARFTQIRSHKKRPSTTDLALIADAFGVTVPWLVTGADENVDVLALPGREAEHVRHEMAATDSEAGLADLKQRLKNPKPTVGYLVVRRGWNPCDGHDRLYPWNPHASQKAAEADRAHLDSLGHEPRMIVRVDTTFTIVDNGGCGG